jgi:hypothetical protein
LGNGIATAVVAKWEGAIDAPDESDNRAADPSVLQPKEAAAAGSVPVVA